MDGIPIYSYGIEQFGGKIALGVFENTIRASKIAIGLHEIRYEGGLVDVHFLDVLSDEDEAFLTHLVGQHDGEFLPKEIIAKPTWEFTNGLNPKWTSHMYTTNPQSINIFDEKITTEIVIRGGEYQIFDENASLGDYVEFAVVDKDDTLGIFSDYGLTVGQPGHLLELTKYVKKNFVLPGQKGFEKTFEVNGGRDVMPGLYLRTIYNSVGTEPVKFVSRVKNYE